MNAKQELKEKHVPGLEELQKAQEAARTEAMRYSSQMMAMMEDEYNDGARPPKPLDESLQTKADEMAKQYPRAAVYLTAKGYQISNNINKYSAGKKAQKIITTGGKIEEAEDALKNWVPEDEMWR